jgi:hypothetical protein
LNLSHRQVAVSFQIVGISLAHTPAAVGTLTNVFDWK